MNIDSIGGERLMWGNRGNAIRRRWNRCSCYLSHGQLARERKGGGSRIREGRMWHFWESINDVMVGRVVFFPICERSSPIYHIKSIQGNRGPDWQPASSAICGGTESCRRPHALACCGCGFRHYTGQRSYSNRQKPGESGHVQTSLGLHVPHYDGRASMATFDL